MAARAEPTEQDAASEKAEPASTDAAAPPQPAAAEEPSTDPTKPKKRRRSWLRRIGILFVFLLIVGIAVRLALPSILLWYVNRIIDRNPLYDGKVGDIDVSLYRGAYTIKDIRINKVTGNVPVPLFSSPRVDLAIEWHALLNRKIVGRIVIDEPELNFVDGEEASEDQTGAGGPWLEIIRDLFPFKINSAVVRNGSIHFRAFASNPPLDLALTNLDASVENLSNIQDDVTPLISTVKATGLAMGQAKLEYEMKIDPFSYKPTFQMALRLLGLDVTKTNDFARAYGAFDFESGWFDLVVELDSKEGQMQGYVKPLFRNLKVLSLRKDIKEDNPIEFFWEALVGAAAEILKNHPRDQVGTVIPVTGDTSNPNEDILATIGNVLRNAFIRAYLPRREGLPNEVEGLHFGPATLADPPGANASP